VARRANNCSIQLVFCGLLRPSLMTEETMARTPISSKLLAAGELEESTGRESHLPHTKKPRVNEPEILPTRKVRVFPDAAQREQIRK